MTANLWYSWHIKALFGIYWTAGFEWNIGLTSLQSKDASLRQMSYVVLKELTRSAEDIIMVTSSIMKDMATGSEVVYRANAVRAVIRVIDAQSAQAIERPLKTCIVDKSPVRFLTLLHALPNAVDVC